MQRQSLTTSHRWADAQPGASKRWLTLLKLHFFPFLAEHNVTWYGIFVWLVWVLCPAVSPANLLCPCQSVHWGTVPVWFLLLVFIMCITTLGVPVPWEGIRGLQPAQACSSLQNPFVSCLIFILCFGLSHIFSWSTQLTSPFIYSKGHPLVPLCVETKSFFARAVVCHTPCYSELYDIALGRLHWAFFHFRGLLVSHKALTRTVGCMGVSQILKVLDLATAFNSLLFLGRNTKCDVFLLDLYFGRANKDCSVLPCR